LPDHFTAIRLKNVYIAMQQQSIAAQTCAARCETLQELVMIVTHVIARIRSYMRYRASVRALSVLSERELSDIGLTRGDIHTISRQSATA
jgi:uncharacterized protein YjiS (DUF1127 family)